VAKKVIVVGAGIAGLGAAWRLARQGFEVSVLEREARPGGRMRSMRREGFVIEPNGGLFSNADRAFLSWIGELRQYEMLPLRPVLQAQVYRNRAQAIDPRNWAGIARIPGMRIHQALRLLRLRRLDARYGDRINPDRPELAAGLDDRSLADFGRLYFGDSVVERWMSPAVACNALASAGDVSRVLFLLHNRERADARLGLLRSSMEEFLEVAAAAVSTRFGAEVTRIDRRPGGGVRYLDGDRAAEADAVIVTGPATEVPRLFGSALSTAERDSFGKVKYIPSISLAVALRHSPCAHPQSIVFPHVEASPLETVLLEPGSFGGRVPEGRGLALLRATGSFSEAYFGAPDDTVCKELIAASGRIFPRIGRDEIFTEVIRLPEAVPRFDVGRYREIAQFDRLQGDQRREGRRIYFAGDYLMGPGLDAALRSGQRAAAAVAEDLGPIDRVGR
jgi:oxygen-dependent protoporphyrinogen oxidase